MTAPIAPGGPASIAYAQQVVAQRPDSTMALPNFLAENVPAASASTTFTPATGTLYLWAVHLGAGTLVSDVGFVTATTAAVTPAHWWTCLVDQKYKLLAASADQATGAIAASTWFSPALAAAYTTTYSGLHYLGVMIAAATMPTLCSNPSAPLQAMLTGAGAPASVIGGASNTGATTPPAVGTTLTAPTAAQTVVPYLNCA